MSKYIFLIFIPIVIVYLFALPMSPMEMDAAQYAAMTVEMLGSGNWLHFTDLGSPYLDKPPLVFWTAGICYKLFGINAVSYKIPSFLFWMLSLFSLYRFAKIYYQEEIALAAALILATTQAAFLLTNDCRTDTLLTGAVMFSIWQLAAYWEARKWYYFVGGFVGIALAMLAKGPIGAMIPIWALGGHFLFTKQWKAFFHPQWLLGIIIVLLVLSPMIWGLYTQFDLQPDLIVHGKKGVSGLRFYFWTQSFGRVTGESTWQNDSGYDFFIHTTLWAYLPYSLLLFTALFFIAKSVFKKQVFLEKKEYISIFGFILTFLAFSLSKYKLPHYIFVVYPLAAILVALYLNKVVALIKPASFWFWLQNITGFLLFAAAFVVCTWIFYSPFFIIICSLLFFAYLFIIKKIVSTTRHIFSFLIPSVFVMLSINTIASLHFYPNLMKYQSANAVGSYIANHHLPSDKIYMVVFYSCPDVEIGKRVKKFNPEEVAQYTKDGAIYVYAPADYLHALQGLGRKIKILATFEDFKVTHLSLKFLNPKTRASTLQQRILVKLY